MRCCFSSVYFFAGFGRGERESSQEKKYYPWRVCPGKKKPKNVRESFEIKNKYNNDIRYTRPCCDRPGILYWKKPYR
jgi:hypothetical protein